MLSLFSQTKTLLALILHNTAQCMGWCRSEGKWTKVCQLELNWPLLQLMHSAYPSMLMSSCLGIYCPYQLRNLTLSCE